MGDIISKYLMRVTNYRLGTLMGIFDTFELVDSSPYKVVPRTARTILAVKKKRACYIPLLKIHMMENNIR